MNRGITLGRKGETYTVITDPSVPFSDQRRAFKQLSSVLSPEEYDEIELWSTSQGRVAKRELGRKSGIVVPPEADETQEGTEPAANEAGEAEQAEVSETASAATQEPAKPAKPAKGKAAKSKK